MIYISSSFPKSASTLLFLYTEALLSSEGKKNGQQLFRRFYKEGYVAEIGFFNGLFFLLLSFLFKDIVVKTHGSFRYMTRWMVSLGLARASYIYRDPRDIMLSVLDHGAKARRLEVHSPADQAQLRYESEEQLYPLIETFYHRYLDWKKDGRNEMITYHELIAEPLATLRKHAHFMQLTVSEEELTRIVAHFETFKKETKHFNTAKLQRFEEEMNPELLRKVETKIGYCILGMGFKLVTGGNKK